MSILEKWYNLSVEETIKKQETNEQNGLTIEQISKKREKYGLNELKEKKFICKIFRTI